MQRTMQVLDEEYCRVEPSQAVPDFIAPPQGKDQVPETRGTPSLIPMDREARVQTTYAHGRLNVANN